MDYDNINMWGLSPLIRNDSIIGYSIMNNNFRPIRDKLEEHGIEVDEISSHELFGRKLYLVSTTNGGCTSIANALNISNDCVELYKSYWNRPSVYAIDKTRLDTKYLKDGKLVFDEEFDIKEYFKDHGLRDFRDKFAELMDVCISKWFIDRNTESVMLTVRNEPDSFNRWSIANKLKISYLKISCFSDDDGWIYVLDLREVVNNE